MALQISSYVDPGVYIAEVVVPGALNIQTPALTAGIIGPGSRTKGVTNEAIQRGLVEDEDLNLNGFLAFTNAAPATTVAITTPGTIASLPNILSDVVVLTHPTQVFPTSVIGKDITIRGLTGGDAGNNGVFTILGFAGSAAAIAFINTSAVALADVGGGGGTYTIRPHVELDFRSDNALQNTTVTRNGRPLSNSVLAYSPAFIESDPDVGGFVMAAGDSIVLSLDGKKPLTIQFTDGAAGATPPGNTILVTQANALTPTQLIVDYNSDIAAHTTFTAAELVRMINAVMASPFSGDTYLGSGLGYETPAYDNVATVNDSGASDRLLLRSPNTTPASRVEVTTPIAGGDAPATDGTFIIFGAAAEQSDSFIEIKEIAYSALSQYNATYVNIDDLVDTLANTGVQSVSRVGDFAGVSTYEVDEDFVHALSSTTLDWSILTAPKFTSTLAAANYDVTTTNLLNLSFDGQAAVEVNVALPATGIFGYIDLASLGGAGSAALPGQLAANINAIIGGSATYGPAYNAVASVVSGRLTLTSPNVGEDASVTLVAASTAASDAALALFGVASNTLPQSRTGEGSRPTIGAIYFASYQIDRPASDYNVQKRYFSLDQARADLGEVSADNPLMLAMQVAFSNGAPTVVAVQVNDSTFPGNPTRSQFKAALTATQNSDIITEVVMLSTDLAVQTDLRNHIETQSSPTEKHYRRGYFGMARDTDPGDADTPDTFVYRATRTLQVLPDSPGRGRMALFAPPQRSGVSWDIDLSDGTTETVLLDSSYIAVAWAALRTALTSPALSLARRTITGFNIDISDRWLKGERQLMASSGVFVTTFDAGLFKVLDPVTTEAGGGGLAAFSYLSTSTQKDNVTRKVDKALDANIVGVVPIDLADFVIDIKEFISDAIGAEIADRAIGQYVNADGTVRRVDLATDIEVSQDPNDPTKFYFKYFFNLRYPALRLFGEFSVDNPFFTTQVAA